MAEGLTQYQWSPFTLLLAINALLIVIGTAIEGSSALIVLTPILLPLTRKPALTRCISAS